MMSSFSDLDYNILFYPVTIFIIALLFSSAFSSSLLWSSMTVTSTLLPFCPFHLVLFCFYLESDFIHFFLSFFFFTSTFALIFVKKKKENFFFPGRSDCFDSQGRKAKVVSACYFTI